MSVLPKRLPLGRRHAALMLLALVPSGSLAAQGETGTISGLVVSQATGVPLPGALVALDAGVRTTTAADGSFTLSDVVAGPYRIAAVARGCHVGLGEVTVIMGTVLDVRLTIDLPPHAEPDRNTWHLGDRREGGAVKVITGEEIRIRNLQSIQDAIRLIAPNMIGQESGEAGGRQAIRGRGRTTVTGSSEPLVVLDGVRLMNRPLDALASINPMNVERIVVVKGAAGGWRYGLQGANGVIEIFTRDSTRDTEAGTPPEQCAFRFPS